MTLLFTGYEELSDIMSRAGFHIMAITETWLNEWIPNAVISIPFYTVYKSESRGGGSRALCSKRIFLAGDYVELTPVSLNAFSKN